MKTEPKHTPGPWRWELNIKSKDLNLCGHGECGPYDYTVMDFERWGMGGAVPRFRTEPMMTMVKAHELAVVVKGREHHANWFQNIDHPDARLIAASPELYDALSDAIQFIKLSVPHDSQPRGLEKWDALITALNK